MASVCIQCISLSLHKHESIICAPTRQVGRYFFTLQMVITKQEIKYPSCAYRGTLCRSQYSNAPCLHAAPQGLTAFEAVPLQALWPQAILAASSKTSSVQNKHGMGGEQCSGAGVSNHDKADMRNDCHWTTGIKFHHLSKYNIYIRATSPFETRGLVWNRVELTWKTRLYFEHLFFNMEPCTLCLQLPNSVLTCLCVSGQDCATKSSENRIVPTQTLESVYELWIAFLKLNPHSCWHISQKCIAVHQV